jgi:hypothetical protein
MPKLGKSEANATTLGNLLQKIATIPFEECIRFMKES